MYCIQQRLVLLVAGSEGLGATAKVLGTAETASYRGAMSLYISWGNEFRTVHCIKKMSEGRAMPRTSLD